MTQEDILRTIAGLVSGLRREGAYEDDPAWDDVDRLLAQVDKTLYAHALNGVLVAPLDNETTATPQERRAWIDSHPPVYDPRRDKP